MTSGGESKAALAQEGHSSTFRLTGSCEGPGQRRQQGLGDSGLPGEKCNINQSPVRNALVRLHNQGGFFPEFIDHLLQPPGQLGIGHEFVDEPLRTYSTGMVMRLAFSVAINMDPDVLLVDEILAVGDAAFQEKCFQKVHEFRNSGRSLLCVSHAAGMVQQLCDKAIWLDHGEMVMSGSIAEVLEAYNGRGAIAV